MLPSGFEPWGLVVNEAMCFGLPVIVSDQVGAGGHLVREGTNGYVFHAGDLSTLAKCLKQVLSNNGLKKRMGEASRKIIEVWAYQKCIEGVLTSLTKVILQKGARAQNRNDENASRRAAL